MQRTAEFLDYFVKRQQEDPEGLEDALKLARLLDPSDLILGQVLSADQKLRIAELIDDATERLKPYLDDVATKLETGRVNDETALLLTGGAIIAVAKYAPKTAKTRAFAQIGTVLRRIAARIGLAQRKRELVESLLRQGAKVSPDAVVDIRRLSDGRIVWLEKGDDAAGLRHLIREHGQQFARKGIGRTQLSDFLMQTLIEGKIVGTNGGEPVYRVLYNGSVHYVKLVTGSNGFLVTAHPVSKWKPLL